jgi:hypothetical protein
MKIDGLFDQSNLKKKDMQRESKYMYKACYSLVSAMRNLR